MKFPSNATPNSINRIASSKIAKYIRLSNLLMRTLSDTYMFLCLLPIMEPIILLCFIISLIQEVKRVNLLTQKTSKD